MKTGLVPRTAVPILQAAIVPAAVIGLADWQPAAMALLLALSWLLWRGATREWRRLFGLAAVLGTIGEVLCVLAPWTPDGRGLWVYHFPPLFGCDLPLPLWLPLVWGNLFTLFAALSGMPAGIIRCGGEPVRYLLTLLIIAYAGVIYCYVALPLLILFTPFLAALLLYWNRAEDFTLFLVAGLGGTLGEFLAMRAGLWTYTMPVIRGEWAVHLGLPGFPISLVMAWGLCGVIFARLARERGEAAQSRT